MNLAKFLKGTTSIGELELLPNKYIQVLFKQYTTTLLSKDAQEKLVAEQVSDEVEESMGG